MKNKAVLSALAGMSIVFSGAALAQIDNPNPRSGQVGQPPHQMHGPMNAHRGRGAGPNHNFYRGGRIPDQYRNRRYVVNDWRGHHLSAPPRGYQWVQTGGDYVLVAITTGIIAQVLLGQ